MTCCTARALATHAIYSGRCAPSTVCHVTGKWCGLCEHICDVYHVEAYAMLLRREAGIWWYIREMSQLAACTRQKCLTM